MADKYMEEMVETSFTLKASEKLNKRIYQQFAKEMGSDPVVNSFLTLVVAIF
jgi:hypothetical protein